MPSFSFIKIAFLTTYFMVSISSLSADAVKAARVSKLEIAETKPIILITRAVAALSPTKGNNVQGIISFKQVEGGVLIVANVTGLSPGQHGFHIHEFGDCSAADGSSAGGHFNPTNTKHGGPDHADRHAGDLGNIVADDYGIAHYERVDTVLKLNGPNTIVGRSIIVHANPDDLTTQPTGNAGGRLACGVIVDR